MQTRHGANGEIDAVGDLHACEQVVRICPDASTPGARSVSDRPPTLGRTPSDLTIANRRRIVGLSVQPARPRPCVCSLTSPPRTVRARPLVSPSKAPTGTASALAILTMIASDGLVRPASTLRTKSGLDTESGGGLFDRPAAVAPQGGEGAAKSPGSASELKRFTVMTSSREPRRARLGGDSVVCPGTASHASMDAVRRC